MKHQLITITLLSTLTITSWATEVDFSKAYVIPQKEAINQIGIGGILVKGNDYIVTDSILLGFNPNDASFQLLSSGQQNLDAQWAAQRLRGTTWKGYYRAVRNEYVTELSIQSVQNSFIGGEIVHETADAEPSNSLRTTVAGDFTTQYWVSTGEGKEAEWQDADAVDAEQLSSTTPIRLLARMKRIRALENHHAGSGWGTNNEYRLTIEGNYITGSIGTPSEKFDNSDDMTGNGLIELWEVQ